MAKHRAHTTSVLAAAAALAVAAGCDIGPFAPGSVPAAPTQVYIDAPESMLIEGDSMRLAVRVLGAGNEVVELPPWVAPQWTSLEEGAVTVRGDGTVLSEAAGDATIQVEVSGLTATRQLRVEPEVITMEVAGAYLVQSVQRLDGTVPIMAGRDALLRVFVLGNAAFNTYTPPVHVELFHDGAPVDSLVIPAAGTRVPHELEQGSAFASWNVLIPGDQVVPGLGLRVILDPEETVARTPASRTVFPDGGGVHSVDVRELPPHRVRFVPVHQTGSGTTGHVDETNAASYVSLYQRIFPVPGTEIEIRAPYSTDAVVDESEGWIQLLQEMRTLRLVDESSSYYYGVVRPAGGRWGGWAYIGLPVAVGYDNQGSTQWGWTRAAALFAHEVGHNLGRRHAPCGDPAGVDPEYPYFGATIGVYGYDMVRGMVLHSEHRDIMSYCYDWISDYTYEAAWSFRAQEAAGAAAASEGTGQEPVLLVWGQVRADGSLRLEPAFELVARPTPRPEPGPFAVEGLDAAGNVLFSRSFAGDEVAHAEPGTRLFAFTIPVAGLEPAAIHRLRLTGPGRVTDRVTGRRVDDRRPDAIRSAVPAAGTRIDWRVSDYPMALVRDPETGDVLAIARNGRIELPSHDGPIEVLLSHGTGSVVARVRQP